MEIHFRKELIILSILKLILKKMMYPPKKRAYSPQNTKTKDLSNLMNINSKFIGTGGSKIYVIFQIPHHLHRRNNYHFPSHLNLISSKLKSTYQNKCRKPVQQQTLFKKYYDRGDLPVAVSFVGALRKLTWKMQP